MEETKNIQIEKMKGEKNMNSRIFGEKGITLSATM